MSKIMFKKYDKDGSGNIDSKEFGDLCYSLGHPIKAEELETAVKVLDIDGDGTISYEEFQKWWAKKDTRFELIDSEEGQKWLETHVSTFQAHDADKSGQVDKNEFATLYTKLKETSKGAMLSEDKMFTRIDADNSGFITLSEFLAYLKESDYETPTVKLPAPPVAA